MQRDTFRGNDPVNAGSVRVESDVLGISDEIQPAQAADTLDRRRQWERQQAITNRARMDNDAAFLLR